MPQNIALIGRARSGKDTVAARLVRKHAYTRVAFADPLKDAALRIDPMIPTFPGMGSVRLSTLVQDVGWEFAKDTYPEVRRFLQRMGATMRELDEGFWLNIALDKMNTAQRWNLPVVVTDCRYPNEAEALRNRGFKMVRVVRPVPQDGDQHISETALDDYPADTFLANRGGFEDLYADVDQLI